MKNLPTTRAFAPDFRLTNHGSVCTLTPLTSAAGDWCQEHLPDDAPTFGRSFAVEPRYVSCIADGTRDDGLSLAGDAA